MTTSVVSPGQLRLGVIFIAIAATLWGTVGIATRALFLISDANPLSVGFFRLALSSPVLLLATYVTLGRAGLRIQGRDFWLMLGLGLSMALYQVTYFAAIERLGVTVAVLIALCTCPVMVAVLAAPLLKERLTATVGIAMVLALVGTVLLVGGGPDLGRDRNQMMIGVMLALGTGLSYAFVTMISRTLAPRYHPLQPISLGFTAGALMILPFALAGGLVLDYPPLGWLLLLHLGLIPTAFGYILFLRGMRTTSATVASILTLFEPLTSTILAWWLFQERLGPLGLLGAALLLGAMFILMRGDRTS